VAFGHLHVRGPWITSGYFKSEGGQVLDADGFFPTGDIATIDPDGYVQLVDRAKDVIKSGGEWISSIDVELCANSHPGVAEAKAMAKCPCHTSNIIGCHHQQSIFRTIKATLKDECRQRQIKQFFGEL